MCGLDCCFAAHDDRWPTQTTHNPPGEPFHIIDLCLIISALEAGPYSS